MKDVYIYPAILTYDETGIGIEFPDLPGCLPCADTTEEATKNAREAMGLHLWSMEKDGDVIPSPTDLTAINLEEKQIPLMVEVFMPPIRERQANRFVKKTLSIPSWLNAEAERAGINFSQMLQTSIKEHLGITQQ